MSAPKWQLLTKVSGDLPAEILGGLLKAQGIPVLLTQEGAARAMGVEIGPFGEVEILVASDAYPQAQQVLEDYQNGAYADIELDASQMPAGESDDPEEE